MSIDVAAIVERARLTAETSPDKTGAPGRQQLERVAQEFESMLLTQMLRDMRKAGEWDDEESKDTLGAESMFETLDVELASHLAKIQGIGLSKQLLDAFDRMNPVVHTVDDVPVPGAPARPVETRPAALAPEASVAPAVAPVAPAVDAPVAPPANGPVPGPVTSEFGWRRDPFTGQAKFHNGVDVRAAYGQDVFAAGGGRVIFSGQQGGYGTTVLLEHADGMRTRYAHLSASLVAAGDMVAAGQAVGQAGRSGRATGTHLHFEVIGADGRPMDPRMAGHMGGSALHGD